MQGEYAEENDEYFRDATVTGGFRDAVTLETRRLHHRQRAA
jgi:hypothetical protein